MQKKNEHSTGHLLGELLSNRERKPLGHRYSRLVRALRIFLPITALGIMGIVILISQNSEEFSKASEEYAFTETASNELIKPRFESRDSLNRPYIITAERAVQNVGDNDRVFLEKPEAEITTDKGSSISASAEKGEYNEKKQILILSDDVQLSHGGGYMLETSRLVLNLNKKTADTDMPVSGHGPSGLMHASGMTVYQNENRVILRGPATVTVYSKKGQSAGNSVPIKK